MHTTPVLISLNDAVRVTSLSRTSINRLREAGEFPATVQLGERRVAFVREEVLAWVRDRIDSRAANDNAPVSAKQAA